MALLSRIHPTKRAVKLLYPCTTASRSACFSVLANLQCPDTSHEQDVYKTIFTTNASFRHEITTTHPHLLPALAQGQHPKLLWLGCSDSRCPETTILGLQPGDVFVHRNIANILSPSDPNSLAVIHYAVAVLKVQHVVVAGHTSCGGVAAALASRPTEGVVGEWLAPLLDLKREKWDELQRIEDEKERVVKLVELNVLRSVSVLQGLEVVSAAVKERRLEVHGVVYDVGSGQVREVDAAEG